MHSKNEGGKKKRILHARNAHRSKNRGGRQRDGRGGKGWKGEKPPPPVHHLFIPLEKEQMLRFSGYG